MHFPLSTPLIQNSMSASLPVILHPLVERVALPPHVHRFCLLQRCQGLAPVEHLLLEPLPAQLSILELWARDQESSTRQ